MNTSQKPIQSLQESQKTPAFTHSRKSSQQSIIDTYNRNNNNSKLSDYITRKIQNLQLDPPQSREKIKYQEYLKSKGQQLDDDIEQQEQEKGGKLQQEIQVKEETQTPLNDSVLEDVRTKEQRRDQSENSSSRRRKRESYYQSYFQTEEQSDQQNIISTDQESLDNNIFQSTDMSTAFKSIQHNKVDQSQDYYAQKEKPAHSKNASSQFSQTSKQQQYPDYKQQMQHNHSKSNTEIPRKPSQTPPLIQKSPKILYKNNFSKQSKFLQQAKKEAFSGTLKENLRNEMVEIVQSYERQKNLNQDSDQVEDMILELNRLTQKSNGLIPTKSHSKIQQFVYNVEMQKIPYSRRKSMSPNRFQEQNQQTYSIRKGLQQDPSINVNSKLLKNIIVHTESKVRQSLKGFQHQASASSYSQSQRASAERTFDFKQNTVNDTSFNHNNYQDKSQSVDQTIRDSLNEVVSLLNARNLSQFFKRKVVSPADQDTAYILILIVALVDEQIQLNNDKSDIILKGWEEIVKQLSNHGRVVYSLQKFKSYLDKKEQLLKQIQKLQIIKRYEERNLSQADNLSHSGQIIQEFCSCMVSIFKQLIHLHKKEIQMASQDQTDKKIYKKSQPSSLFSPLNSDHKKKMTLQQSPQSNIYQNSLTERTFNTNKMNQSPTISLQLKEQKQLALTKSYQLQYEQAVNIKEKLEQVKLRELEIRKLRTQQNQLLFQIEKESQRKMLNQLQKEDNEYKQYQQEFNSNLTRVDESMRQIEKRQLRERSIENTEFKKSLRLNQQEGALKKHRESLEKSTQDSQWQDKSVQLQKERKLKELKSKHQEVMIDKVRRSELFLVSKEQELDERLKSQFDNVSYRFRQLDETEQNLKREIHLLAQFAQQHKKQKK